MPPVSLRARLALMVVLALLPALALLVWFRQALGADEREEADSRVQVIAQLVAEGQAARDEGARQMLLSITNLADLVPPGSPDCGEFLRDFGENAAASYVNFGIVGLDGLTVCASQSNTGRNVDISEREFFRRAVETQQFTVGGRLRGANSGRLLVNYLMPIFEGGALGGFAIASLNLDRLQGSLVSAPLALDSAAAILDRDGFVLAKRPSDDWLPDQLDPAMLEAARAADQSQALYTGPDGVERHLGFAWVGGRRDMLAVAGIREDLALAEVNAAALAALSLLVLWSAGVTAFVFLAADQQIRRPLDALLVAARRLGSGDLRARAEVEEGTLGLGELGRALNTMADALEERDRRSRESERLEAIGQIVGGLAHDFNNLLTIITGFGRSLESHVQTEEGRQDLRHVLAAAERAGGLTRELLTFARREELAPQPLRLSDTIASIGPMLQRVAGEGVSMAFVHDPRLGVARVDPARLEQVLLNLVLNARDAMPSGGRITIETRNVTLGPDEAARLRPAGRDPVRPGDYVALEVSDTGMGIRPDVRARIFEPFFTTKGARGTGLGLATAYGLVSQSGGYLSCESEQGAGTTFTILLPRVDEEPETHPVRQTELRTSGSEAVLVVEDEPSVRVLAERVLGAAGYRVTTVDSAAAALASLRGGLAPDVILTDVVMPHMNGVALAESMKAMRPGVRVAFMSGHVDPAVVRAARIPEGAFLRKPFSPDDLLAVVRRVLDAVPERPG